jgi:hypothetical protein
MSSLQQRLIILTDNLAAIADTTIKLKAQLFELDKLREQVATTRPSAETSGGLYANREAMQPLR